MSGAIVIFQFLVLIFSAVFHEVAHGYEADRLGDPTARNAGRLTLNPLRHLDPFGSVIMPLLLYIGSGGAFFFAVAKPVPYDPRNLKNPKTGGARIALAGPATNLLIALGSGIILRILTPLPVPIFTLSLLAVVVYINILLGIFNLVPIPPLDGSKILYLFFPETETAYRAMYFLERWGLFFVLLFVFFGFQLILPPVTALFTLFTGQAFGM